MTEAKIGDIVLVHYTGRMDKGIVVDSSEGAEPVEFKVGEGRMIQGFEEAIIGMAPGEKKVVTIPPDKAYGAYSQEMEYELDRSMLPSDLVPEIGQMLEIVESDGRTIPVEVMDVFDDKVVVNANHPLAGVELVFEISLVAIV
jgi:peptidylprolyl isomerase